MSDIQKIHDDVYEMLVAIRKSLSANLSLPPLVLIYALMDSMAWIASNRAAGTVGARFDAWVNRWLVPELKKRAPEITAIDLYAARCAVLHTLTGHSDLSRS